MKILDAKIKKLIFLEEKKQNLFLDLVSISIRRSSTTISFGEFDREQSTEKNATYDQPKLILIVQKWFRI